MVRIVKKHAVRRNEILDAAQRLIYVKGYEQMAIQEILDELQIAKGTFYHYFASKQSLLEALIERLIEQAEQLLIPVIDDPALSALEKLQRVFDTLSRWKTAQQSYHLALLRVWYSDENAIVRWKLRVLRASRISPLLTIIVRQGITEDVMATAHPNHAGEVVFSLLQEFVDTLAELFLTFDPVHDDGSRLVNLAAAYTDAMERVLGTPMGSFSLVDAATLQTWLNAFFSNSRGSDVSLTGNSGRSS